MKTGAAAERISQRRSFGSIASMRVVPHKTIAPSDAASYRRAVPVRLTILGSGSSGNAAYLEAGETRLLIDAGLSGRQIRQRLLAIGRAPENLSGILLTHEHSDHTLGLSGLASKCRVPIYCNRLTRDALATVLDLPLDFRLFSTGAGFDLGEVQVESFSIPHDAYDPVGFLIRTHEGNFGFLTDLGHATRLVIERVRPANVLLLESNHDVKLLQDDPRRPWSLKQRILSRHGHLSNDAAAEVAAEVASAELQHIFLGHLSGDCNRPELACATVGARLRQIGATHIHLEAAAQRIPCATLTLTRTAAVV